MIQRSLAFALPLLLFAPDASAWGLQTHLFFAQSAILLVPFADPRLRAAVARFPELLCAGACLPDLFLAGKALGTPAFSRAHRWSTLRRLAAVPERESDLAVAAGYASHLVTDVVAHNFFVPEFESRLARIPHFTHALAEWAMDRHLCDAVEAGPRELLVANHSTIAAFVARSFRCDYPLAGRAVALLANADGVLRRSPLPLLCRSIVARLDRVVPERFDSYVRGAQAALPGIEAALAGEFLDWEGLDPEGYPGHQPADRCPGNDIARVMKAEDHA